MRILILTSMLFVKKNIIFFPCLGKKTQEKMISVLKKRNGGINRTKHSLWFGIRKIASRVYRFY